MEPEVPRFHTWNLKLQMAYKSFWALQSKQNLFFPFIFLNLSLLSTLSLSPSLSSLSPIGELQASLCSIIRLLNRFRLLVSSDHQLYFLLWTEEVSVFLCITFVTNFLEVLDRIKLFFHHSWFIHAWFRFLFNL